MSEEMPREIFAFIEGNTSPKHGIWSEDNCKTWASNKTKYIRADLVQMPEEITADKLSQVIIDWGCLDNSPAKFGDYLAEKYPNGVKVVK